MNTHPVSRAVRAALLGSAALATVLPTTSLAAETDDPLAAFTRPTSTIAIGGGFWSADTPRLGQYTGRTRDDSYALGELDLVNRDDATGTWFILQGRNLGFASRDLKLEQTRLGVWGYSLEYDGFTRTEPLAIATALAGIGTPTLSLNAVPARVVPFEIERDRITIGAKHRLPANFDVELRYRHESKDGERIFGRGTAQFLAEPLNSTTEQIDAILRYTGQKLQLAAGYYGSIYTNVPTFIDVNSGADISLPPDNSAHQLYVSGGYSVAETGRLTFKLAHGRARQTDDFFIAPDLPGNTRTNLDGRLDTTLAQLGFSARPLQSLTLAANLRYEDRDDKTPRFQFLTPSTGRDGFNTPLSRSTRNARLEASWYAPLDVRLTAAVDRDERKRSVLSIRQASWREENDETTWRVEARRAISDTLNGAVTVIRAKRGGSDYLPANNNTAADFIDPVHFADRERDKLRVALEWLPTENLALQAFYDDSKDVYDGRPLGPERGEARFYSLDATWTVSEAWQVNAWASREQNDIDQSTITGANGTTLPAQTWQARLRTRGDAFGAGLTGNPSEKLQVGLTWQREIDHNGYEVVATTVPAAALLPDIHTRISRATLFAQYQLTDELDLRMDLAHERFKTDDWTWNGWVYADGTTVALDPSEGGHFIGFSAYYRPRF